MFSIDFKLSNLNMSKKKWLTLAGLVVLSLGLVAGVYLVQKTQILKGRASSTLDASRVFEVVDDQHNTIICQGTSCPTNADAVYIRLKDIAPLLQE